MAGGGPSAVISFAITYGLWVAYTRRRPSIAVVVLAFFVSVCAYSFGAQLVSSSPAAFRAGPLEWFVPLTVCAVTVLIFTFYKRESKVVETNQRLEMIPTPDVASTPVVNKAGAKTTEASTPIDLNNFSKHWLKYAGALILLVFTLFRYDIVGTGAPADGRAASAFVLDRWTGSVTFYYGTNYRETVESKE